MAVMEASFAGERVARSKNALVATKGAQKSRFYSLLQRFEQYRNQFSWSSCATYAAHFCRILCLSLVVPRLNWLQYSA